MAEASLEWKVDMLRAFNSAKPGGHWVPKDAQDTDWFLDMMRDGLIDAKRGYFSESPPVVGVIDFYQPPPNGFYDFHVTEKGKKLIRVYDSKRTVRGVRDKYLLPTLFKILAIVAGVSGGLFLAYLIYEYGFK
jgi:hypothetical protein